MRIKVRSAELVGPVQELWVAPVERPKVKKTHKTLPVRYNGKKGGFTYSLL